MELAGVGRPWQGASKSIHLNVDHYYEIVY
jgi:hypothetical protein